MLCKMSEVYRIGFVVFLSIALRWCISLNGYSGEKKPPMYGDYEAQRHWMEITTNLPVTDWYRNTSKNDLGYWGLDYPPLTAYHSWFCGTFAKYANSSWVRLTTSRGLESAAHKLFMRYTVLAADLWVYIPAVISFFMSQDHLSANKQKLCSFMMLAYPGLLLIDHGHFQYNSMSLGLTLWAVLCLCGGSHYIGSAIFVLALNYKQMELYHALPFFCYLLGTCLDMVWWKGVLKLFGLGAVVIGTFAACWYPFLTDKDTAMQVLQRIFPFDRGLYEDKVANVWCSISVLIKLKNIFSVSNLISICLGSTCLFLIPSSLVLVLKPTLDSFKIALVNASLVFFLFSFQVHEKSILIPAMSVCLLLPIRPLHCTWFLLISGFSMLPLLIKEGLVTPLIGTSVLFYALYNVLQAIDVPTMMLTSRFQNLKYPMHASLMGCCILTVTSLTIPPPAHLPDLHAMLVSVYSCLHFLGFLFYFHWLQVTFGLDHEEEGMTMTKSSGRRTQHQVAAGSKTGRPLHKKKRKTKQT